MPQLPKPAMPHIMRVHHALHEGAGDRGVHRVAARLQDLRPGLGGLRLRGHDHRALAVSHGCLLSYGITARVAASASRATSSAGRFHAAGLGAS